MSPVHVVVIPTAVPQSVVTTDPDQVAAWIADGVATAVYELAATQTYPEPEPPIEEPETPEEPPT